MLSAESGAEEGGVISDFRFEISEEEGRGELLIADC
jgi:hypothetical protein